MAFIEELRTKLPEDSPKTASFWAEVYEQAKLIELKKGDNLVHHLEVNETVYIVLKGSLESCFSQKGFKNKTTWFYIAGEFDVVISIDSYFWGLPSKYRVTALENSEVFAFDRKTIERWKAKHPSFQAFHEDYFLKSFNHFQEIKNSMVALTSADFLSYLEQHYPFLLKRICSHKIADFMGITPEWFSKLKSKRNKLKNGENILKSVS